jgi:DNA-binding MarR family transcriptional regulator
MVAAVRVRLISRAVTAMYERAISGSGLTIAQVNLMTALGKLGRCSQIKLGQLLELERSTVSRNLNLLLKNGWVRAVTSDAKGVREIELTAAGGRKIESVLFAWRAAQKEAAGLIGEEGVRAIRYVADGIWLAGKN